MKKRYNVLTEANPLLLTTASSPHLGQVPVRAHAAAVVRHQQALNFADILGGHLELVSAAGLQRGLGGGKRQRAGEALGALRSGRGANSGQSGAGMVMFQQKMRSIDAIIHGSDHCQQAWPFKDSILQVRGPSCNAVKKTAIH